MSTMTVTGSLATQMDGLVSTFNGAQLDNKYDTGTFLLVYNYPTVVNLYGSDLRVPSTGSSFITGTITEFSYEEVSFAPSITFTEKLVIDGITVDGSSVFDLIARDATTATGKFDVGRFASFLSGESWEIIGSDEADVIGAGIYFDLSGSEVIKAGHGADVIFAGAGNDRVLAGNGRDRLHGGNGNDVLKGGGGKDRLWGDGGNDTLKGGGGNDVLRGDKGDDTLDGGGGADRFVFKRGDGSDTINNFNTFQDAIQIGRGASEFDDLTITQSGSDVEVTFANVSITLDGLDVADVTSDLFLF